MGKHITPDSLLQHLPRIFLSKIRSAGQSISNMPKERSINPAAAQRKADKKKEIAKSRRTQETQRNEKLARRNPERLQRQVDELKELEANGSLRPKDKENLAQLEKDLKGVRRAREALGVKDEPRRDRDGARNGRQDVRQEQRERRQHLGKRRRDDEVDADGSDTDPEVRSIPMPRDTPPPIPRQVFRDPQVGPGGQRVPHGLPSKPVSSAPPPKLTYGAAPQVKDLKKEAVRFMPSVVSQQRNRVKGQGRLLEPEELDKLEKGGYAAAQKAADEAALEARFEQVSAEIRAERADVDPDDELARLEQEIGDIYPEEAEKLGAGTDTGIRNVQMEEVEDDGD
jgi:hypothetical protein